MKESAIQKKILDYLDAKGCFTVKVISANKNGIPDILCCYKGQMIGFEVKGMGGVVSEMQKFQVSEIRKAGGVAEVVRSVDEVRHALDKLSRVDENGSWRDRNDLY